MNRNWETTFSSWAGGPGSTEDRHCENARRAVRDAINESANLKYHGTDVFLQGSYRNRVNVRQNSDVDLGIVCHKTFFYDLPDNYADEYFGITPATYSYPDFKNDVENALISHFGRQSVHRGNKAFDIRANTYRVEADAAPFFDYRYYGTSGRHLKGVELRTDNGDRVINWPDQHYDNGVSKNSSTSRRYKRLVRIIKRLCNEMDEKGIAAARSMPGFLLECLVWNVPNENFGSPTYSQDVRSVLAYVFNGTLPNGQSSEWVEVSKLKVLFHKSQSWNTAQAHAFTDAAWNYVGLE